MNRIVTGAAATLLIAAYSLLANPALAQPHDSASAGCTGDYCLRRPHLGVLTWPLERWHQVRRAQRKLTTNTTDPTVPKDAKAGR